MNLFQYPEASLKTENKTIQKIAIIITGKRNKQKQTNNIPEQRFYLKYLL